MMTSATKTRCVQGFVLIAIFGLTYMAWMHVPPIIYGCPPDESIARTKQTEFKCSVNSILCGVRDFEESQNLPDFNKLQSEFYKLMTTIDFKCPTTLRFGRAGDGGYEACMMKTVRPNNNSCLVYSFGISNDWSFDEAWAKHGCEVHSFDPSIGLEDHVHSPNVTFHKLGLWGSDYTNRNGWKLERISTIRKKLGHNERIIDALKIDVEGGEWPFLRDVIYSDTTSLSNVRQLYIELHTPKLKHCSNMLARDFAEINDYVRRLRDDLGFLLYKNVQHNDCCGRFSPVMPPRIPEKCCHEVFFVNSLLLTT